MIEIEGLTKRFGPVVAVDRLSFAARSGLVTGFLGPNGAGKTTTLRCLLGLEHPSSGRATIGGRPYRELPSPLREVGAVLDPRAFLPGLPAARHLEALARSDGLPLRRVAETLELVGLAGVASRRAGAFSLGMSQRLAIAAALLGDPTTLVFDEPLNGLDPEGIRWVRSLLRQLAGEGRCVLVSSHLMSEMALVADRVVVVDHGRLVADATVDELTAGARARVLVRSPDRARLEGLLESAGGECTPEPDDAMAVVGLTAAQIGEVAAREGIVLHELTPQRASLEAAFMELVRPGEEFRPDTGPALDEPARVTR